VQDITAYVRGLEAALQSLPADPSAATSIRRLSRSLAHAAEADAATDLASRAHRVHGAGASELEQATRDLLAHVEALRAPPPDQDLEVLVVEDDRTLATAVHAYLKKQARRVHVAATAREAESLLASHPIDVVILDLILPDRDGRDLLVQLREDPRTADLPIIILSGETGPVARAECLAVGASDFLVKPPDPKVLRAAVARHAALRRGGGDPPSAAARTPAPTETDAPIRALLVEDDRVTVTLIRHRLTRDGIEVTDFSNGEDALRWAAVSSFDVAILDVKVPGMDGFELLARLRKLPNLAGVPILMLTGLSGEADVVRGLELGANDYMVKPFSPAELLARVRRLVVTPAGAR
jgi:DNA-binding response OmpR family regulator